jgi:hypothetical protein
MRYLRIYAGDDGSSRFEDCELNGKLTEFASGIPPVLLSGPFACAGILFVESAWQLGDAFNWEAHVAPHKQWVIVTSGRFAVTVSDGTRKEVGPGSVILVEDTTGRGHLTTPVTGEVVCAVIPITD